MKMGQGNGKKRRGKSERETYGRVSQMVETAMKNEAGLICSCVFQ